MVEFVCLLLLAIATLANLRRALAGFRVFISPRLSEA